MSSVQGEPWQAVIKGHELDPLTQQQDQQRLLLERFQQEVWGMLAAVKQGGWCCTAAVPSCSNSRLLHKQQQSICTAELGRISHITV